MLVQAVVIAANQKRGRDDKTMQGVSTDERKYPDCVYFYFRNIECSDSTETDLYATTKRTAEHNAGNIQKGLEEDNFEEDLEILDFCAGFGALALSLLFQYPCANLFILEKNDDCEIGLKALNTAHLD